MSLELIYVMNTFNQIKQLMQKDNNFFLIDGRTIITALVLFKV